MPTSNNISFPGWDSICRSYISKYKEELNLSEGFYEHFIQQFNILKKNLFTPEGGIRKLHSREFQDNKKNVIVANEFQENELISSKLQDKLGSNQFLTLYNSRAFNFEWIDERVENVLNIPRRNFSIEGIRGFDTKLNLYHPMDVLHFMRYGTLVYLVSSLKGIKMTAMKDFYSVVFRMGQNLEDLSDDVNQSTKIVERKCYPVKLNYYGETADQNHSTLHLDVWSVTENVENHKYVKPNIEFVGNAKMTKFINTLFYIYNAKVLRFNPKDLAVLSFLDDFDQPEETRTSMNRDVRKFSGRDVQFAAKAFTDFSYYLNKRLTKSLMLYSLGSENNSSYYNRLNRLGKAKSLGLLPLSAELKEIILSKVQVK